MVKKQKVQLTYNRTYTQHQKLKSVEMGTPQTTGSDLSCFGMVSRYISTFGKSLVAHAEDCSDHIWKMKCLIALWWYLFSMWPRTFTVLLHWFYILLNFAWWYKYSTITNIINVCIMFIRTAFKIVDQIYWIKFTNTLF